tara:strand:+ start:458 stop:961 length:504 start_codon:yes stop_codon:yes gene_type:complete
MKILNYFLVLLMIVFSVNTSIALENKPVMDLTLAKKLADACEAKKATTDWRPLNIAIVDAGADLILFRRQDGAFLGSVDIAINKAVSAVMIPYPTRVIGDLAYGKDGNPGRVPGISTVDFLVPFAGGLPIRTESGHLIGAIGISGASSDQDEECAQAAIDAVQDYLK